MGRGPQCRVPSPRSRRSSVLVSCKQTCRHLQFSRPETETSWQRQLCCTSTRDIHDDGPAVPFAGAPPRQPGDFALLRGESMGVACCGWMYPWNETSIHVPPRGALRAGGGRAWGRHTQTTAGTASPVASPAGGHTDLAAKPTAF